MRYWTIKLLNVGPLKDGVFLSLTMELSDLMKVNSLYKWRQPPDSGASQLTANKC